MEQIKILFFVLGSFFGIEDGRIAADTTMVTVYPESRTIEIIQENLFAMVQSEKDSTLVLEQWGKIANRKEKETLWAKELDSFATKDLVLTIERESIQSHLKLTYLDEKDVRAMGIWYDAEKNQFSVNHVPRQNIKTNDGVLEGNYWVFSGDTPFSFTLEPFLEMPENYLEYKYPLMKFVSKNN